MSELPKPKKEFPELVCHVIEAPDYTDTPTTMDMNCFEWTNENGVIGYIIKRNPTYDSR